MDYPCLYYLNGKVNDKTACKFLCGLGTMFGMNLEEVSDSSILFAAASKVLFNGKGFNIDEIKRYGETVFSRPFSTCSKLSRWRILGDLDLPNRCCIYCPLSSTYKNARIDLERMNLRSVIYTGNINRLESKRFLSVVSVSPDNDIGKYPLIPLLGMLNQFFTDNEGHGPYDNKDELIDAFYIYVCAELAYTDEKHKKAVLDCVKRELNVLYDYDLTTLNTSVNNTLYFDLMAEYHYDAPRIMAPVSSSEAPKIVPKKNKSSNVKVELPNQKPLQAINNSEASRDSKNNNKDRDKKSGEPRVNTTPTSSTSKEVGFKEDVFEDNILKSDALDSSPALVSDNVNDSNLCVRISPFNSEYILPDSVSHKILHCTDDNAKAILTFITDICSSRYVCAESVVVNKRHGLLLMTTFSGRFYFFDLEYAPPGHLYPALKDASKMKLLSLSPLPVISMLNKLGFDSLQVESLSGLYCLVNSINSINDYEKIFIDELSISKKNDDEFFYYYMPSYESLYTCLMNKIECSDNKSLVKKYVNGTRLDAALGVNYDLSDILYGLTNSITGHGFYDYQFNYNKDIPYIKSGVLYIVMLDVDFDDEVISENDFYEEVAVQVNRSKLECVRYARLISFIDKGIVYYTTMHGDMFFDVLIDVVRRNLKKYYSIAPSLKTYRVEYN